jgi:hypothetical protein
MTQKLTKLQQNGKEEFNAVLADLTSELIAVPCAKFNSPILK